MPAYVEYIAAGFGLLCVFFYTRQSIWCWPAGLVQVALYMFIFFEARLYSDVGLNFIYVFMQAYGWWYWATRRGPVADGPPVRDLPPWAWLFWGGVIAIAALAIGQVTAALGAVYPVLDAGLAAASLVAQWLIGRKVLGSWLIWIGVDVISIWLYFDRGLHVTAALYAVFLVLAVRGYFAWAKVVTRERRWA